MIQGEGYSFDIDRLVVANSDIVDAEPRRRRQLNANAFTGHMQNMMFGPLNVFELIQRTQVAGAELPDGIATVFSTGELTNVSKPIPLYPVTFKPHAVAYVSLPSFDARQSNGSLRVMFRTVQQNALLLYNDGTAPDFLAVRLIGGRLRLSANDGGGSVELVHPAVELCDNRWHVVDVRQLSAKSFSLAVDGESSVLNLTTKMNTFDLTGPLYVGGLPDRLRDSDSPHAALRDVPSYSGCVGTVTISDVIVDVMLNVSEASSASVVPGCHSE